MQITCINVSDVQASYFGYQFRVFVGLGKMLELEERHCKQSEAPHHLSKGVLEGLAIKALQAKTRNLHLKYWNRLKINKS